MLSLADELVARETVHRRLNSTAELRAPTIAEALYAPRVEVYLYTADPIRLLAVSEAQQLHCAILRVDAVEVELPRS